MPVSPLFIFIQVLLMTKTNIFIGEMTKNHETVESLVDSFIDLLDSRNLFVDGKLQYNSDKIQSCSLDDIDDDAFQEKLNDDLLTREELRETLVAYQPCRLQVDLVSLDHGVIAKTSYINALNSHKEKNMSSQDLTAQNVDPVVLNQIKYHIDSLARLMNTYGVKIAVDTQTGYASLLPKSYEVVANDDPSVKDEEPACLGDFQKVDLPIEAYDYEYQSILPAK